MDSWRQLEISYWRILAQQAVSPRFSKECRAFELGLSFKGLTARQQRDFDFYLSSARQEKCYPNHFCAKSKLCYRPQSVEEWFYLWDTHGYADQNELTQPHVSDCEGIKQTKEFVNLTIKMWVQDAIDLPAVFDFERVRQAYPMPWVWKAFRNQAKKDVIHQDGFLTNFLKRKLDDNNQEHNGVG